MNSQRIPEFENRYLCQLKASVRPKACLLCFPYAGASANIYRKWSDLLPETIDLYGVQYRGRGYRISEVQHTSISAIVDDLLVEIKYLLDTPLVLFGHSLGAIIAYEFARALSANCTGNPAHLFVSGLTPPHIEYQAKKIHHLPDDDFIREISVLNGTPEEVLNNFDLLRLVLPSLRADLYLAENWTYNDKYLLPTPVTVMAGHEDNTVQISTIQEWGCCSSGPVNIHLFPGDHFFIEEHFEKIVGLISQSLPGDESDAERF